MNGLATNSTTPETLCRDCARIFAYTAEAERRCPHCHSPRLITHPEIATLGLAHLDCDAFFAAIEKRDNPALRDKPVIVGGGQRGVVSTCCYIARIYGVHSAMPMFKAKKACPQAVVVSPDSSKYVEAGRQIRAMMGELTPLVEPLSIDEAFMDLRGTEKLHGGAPAQTLTRLMKRIEKEVGITVSVGLSHNKFLAKLASDFDKPRGFSVIGEAETLEVLATLPVGRIWGVGRALQAKLARDGIHTVGQLQKLDATYLLKRYDSIGLRLARLSRGEDYRAVAATRAPVKSVSNETTFRKDLRDAAALEKHLWRLCEKTASRCKAKQVAGKTITLKLKTARFASLTRNRTLPDPTQLAEEIFAVGKALLHQTLAEKPNTAYRLIGIGVSALVDEEFADPQDLADPDRQRRKAAEQAMDKVRDKFGQDAIKKGRGL